LPQVEYRRIERRKEEDFLARPDACVFPGLVGGTSSLVDDLVQIHATTFGLRENMD
jgi:hypothetical protein